MYDQMSSVNIRAFSGSDVSGAVAWIWLVSPAGERVDPLCGVLWVDVSVTEVQAVGAYHFSQWWPPGVVRKISPSVLSMSSVPGQPGLSVGCWIADLDRVGCSLGSSNSGNRVLWPAELPAITFRAELL